MGIAVMFGAIRFMPLALCIAFRADRATDQTGQFFLKERESDFHRWSKNDPKSELLL